MSLTSVAPLVGGLFNIIDDMFTTDSEREQAKLKVLELQNSGALAQLEVNLKEAQHKSVFVAGWRPAVGWVCVLSFGWAYIISPALATIIMYISVITGYTIDLSVIPEPDTSAMLPVLMGMLGLGAMRTWEKQHGVASTTM